MFVCCGKDAGKVHNMKTGNKTLESLEDFKYLVITLMNKNRIHDKIEIF